jgi:hypothetical protein
VDGWEWETDEALEKGKEALARGDGRAAYLGYISKLNFDGSGAAHFEEGLAWNSSGEYAVSRKSLRKMVDDAVIGLRTWDPGGLH